MTPGKPSQGLDKKGWAQAYLAQKKKPYRPMMTKKKSGTPKTLQPGMKPAPRYGMPRPGVNAKLRSPNVNSIKRRPM